MLAHTESCPSRNILQLIQKSCISPQSSQPPNTSRSVAVLTAGALVGQRDEISGSETFGRVEPLVAMCILFVVNTHTHRHSRKKIEEKATHTHTPSSPCSLGILRSPFFILLPFCQSHRLHLLCSSPPLAFPPRATGSISCQLPSLVVHKHTLGSVTKLNFCSCRSALVHRLLRQSFNSSCRDFFFKNNFSRCHYLCEALTLWSLTLALVLIGRCGLSKVRYRRGKIKLCIEKRAKRESYTLHSNKLAQMMN